MTENLEVLNHLLPMEVGVFLGVKIIESPCNPHLKATVRKNNRHAYLKLRPKFKPTKSK